MNGEARLRFARRGDHTVLVDAAERFPLSIRGPLAGSGREARVALVTGGGGLLDDHLHITIHTEAGARVRLQQLGATRLLPGKAMSTSLLEAHLEPHSQLIALAEPYIPCGAVAFEQRTRIVLEEGASAFVGDVLTPGREGLGERFIYRSLDFKLQVFMGSTPLLYDRLSLEPASGHLPMLLGRYSHVATLAVLGPPATAALPRVIHDFLQVSQVTGGASQPAPGVVVVRLLGTSAFKLHQLLEVIVRLAGS